MAIKLPQGPVFVDGILNSTEVVRQLILQDRHVTYREIETTLGISGTSIYSILHENLTIKKICSRWPPHNLSIAQKKSINQSGKSASTIGSNAYKSDLNGEYFEKQ